MSVVPQPESAAGNLLGWTRRGEPDARMAAPEWDIERLGRLQAGTAKALSILLTRKAFVLAANEALAAVGEAAEVDRAYYFAMGGDAGAAVWFEWSGAHAGCVEAHGLFKQALVEGLPRWKSELVCGHPVQGRLLDFPEEERALLERAGISSCLAVPIVDGKKLCGVLGLEDCRRAREWKESETSLLYMLAGGLHAGRTSQAARERSEDALRQSEERLSLAISASRGGFWDSACVAGPTLTFSDECYMSPEQKGLIGYREDELPDSGVAWLARVEPSDLPVLYGAIQQHHAMGTPFFQAEYRIRHRDNSLRWVETRGKIITDDKGAPRRCIGIVWDMTERKLAEQERAELLSEREREREYLETLVAHAPVGIAVVDGPDHRVTLANPMFLSVAAHPVIGRPLAESMPEAPAEFWSKLGRMWIDGRSGGVPEYQACDRDKQVRYWNVRFVPLRKQGKAVETALVILLDITEQVMARRRLLELAKTAESNYSQLEAVINSMSDGVIICSADGRIVRMNPAAKAMYNFDKRIPSSLVELRRGVDLCDMAGAPVATEALPLSQVLSGRNVENLDLRAFRKNTLMEWVGCYNGTPIRDGAGRVVMAVVTVRDVTLSRMHDRQLREWNETLAQRVGERTQSLLKYQSQLRELAGQRERAEQRTRKQVADDLHDWVAQDLALCGWKLGMARQLVRSKAARAFLAEAEALLGKSLQYTRTMISQLSPIALHEAGLGAALRYLGEQMMQYGLAVEVEAGSDTDDLPEEEGLLVFQMVRELLFNVVKHSGVNKAKVTARRTLEGIVVSVADAGKGFEAQEDSKSSTSGGKYGLFSIRERLEALGGWLSVESHPGKGTIATLLAPLRLTLPMAPPEVVSGIPGPANVALSATRLTRVVVADDHKAVRAGLRALLDGCSELHVVGEASNGEEAVELAGKLKPDAIIMDVNMPKMNGLQATRQIKREHPEIVVIGLSVYNDRQITETMMEAGAFVMLNKGGQPEELYQAIRDARGMCGARKAESA